MSDNPFTCLDDRRRRARRENGLNGIDSVRIDKKIPTKLLVTLLRPWDQADTQLSTKQVRLEGGRLRNKPSVKSVEDLKNDSDEFGVVLSGPLNPGTYSLRLSDLKDPDSPPPGFDSVFVAGRFEVRPDHAPEEDCIPEDCPPRLAPPGPVIDYLAKDYASFRRLLLDRLAQTLPDWRERRAADLGVTLVELLAYIGDHLSYYQDAVATESYLRTARRRVSVRRHVRLVDYAMHDGCNARAWVHAEVDSPVSVNCLIFFTEPDDRGRRAGRPPIRFPNDLLKHMERDRVVFEPMSHETNRSLVPEQNLLPFYPWGDGDCCLPKGATSATIALLQSGTLHITADGDLCGLQPGLPNKQHAPRTGDLLLLEEVRGAITGQPADADPKLRHVVRLTKVRKVSDPSPPPPVGHIRPGENALLFDIAWDRRDALPFSLCLSRGVFDHVSVARGNVMLVDQGLSVDDVIVPQVRQPELPEVETSPCDMHPTHGEQSMLAPLEEHWPRTAQYQPLPQFPLTQSAPFPEPARQARVQARRLSRWRTDVLLPWLRRSNLKKAVDFRKQAPSVVLRELNDSLQRIVAGLQSGFLLTQADVAELTGILGGVVPPLQSDVDMIGPACDDLRQDPHVAIPAIRLVEILDRWAPPPRREHRWEPRRDLFASGPDDRHFVVEINDDGVARLRFGDGRTGMVPQRGTEFRAEYRVGNATAGNVGAETIRGWLGGGLGVRSVRNPLPAVGGVDPEPAATAKLLAPTAFLRDLRRAITAEDYARLAERDERVQRAAAELLWTGIGYDVRVALDLHASALDVPNPIVEERLICAEVQTELSHYRRMGHEVSVVPARFVPIIVHLRLWLKPHAQEARVRANLRAILGRRDLLDGGRGLFHPDNLTFGKPIYGSVLVTAAQKIDGVESVELLELRRSAGPGPALPPDQTLVIGPLEVAQLDEEPDGLILKFKKAGEQ